ncbi:MAG: hypothetical protein IT363_07505 [Methanoregulaceae archaeon]|nr:hypothetical protein [Methanoregulaceae archaeon]
MHFEGRETFSLWRLAGLVLLAMAAPGSIAQTIQLIGGNRLTEAEAVDAVGNRGVVLRKTIDGFFEVRLRPGLDRIRFAEQMKQANIEFVFELSATRVDRQNLASLRRHIDYVKARNKVQATGPDYRKTPGIYAALEYYLSTRVGLDGTVDQDLIKRAVEHREQLPPASLGGGGHAPSASFSYIGPKNLDIPYQQFFGRAPLAGRVNGIAWSPSNANVIYLATAGGGVWRSSDQGKNWSFRSAGWQFLHTTGIAVHPTNENFVLAGTGDAYGFFGAQTMGIMRSTNSGSTWTQVGAAQFGNNIVSRIIYDPDNPNTVLALTMGANGDIWRSTDGGLTWTATDAPARSWQDIDFGTLSNGTRELWAVSGDGGTGGTIMRSTNGGRNWTAMTSPMGGAQERLDVACSKVTFGKVYLLSSEQDTMWRTQNSGTTWTNLDLPASTSFPKEQGNNPNYNWAQDEYDMHVTTAAYGNEENVWVGLITLAVSTDSGATWVNFSRSYDEDLGSRMHCDQHTFTPHPTYGYIGLAGCDGGVFRTQYYPGFLDSIASLNGTLYNHQFYHMSLHPTSYADRMMGGTQDNASPASRGNLASWKNLYAGDGSWSDFDPNDPNIHVTSSQRASVYRYTTASDTEPDRLEPEGGFASAEFIAPLIYAWDGTLLVGASNRVQRWIGDRDWTFSGTSMVGQPRVIAKQGISSARMYAGTSAGRVYRSDDHGHNWTRIDAAPLSVDAIGGIAVSWASSTDVLVGINRPTGGLFRCSNTLAASPVWTDVSSTGSLALPQTPVNAVVRDPYQNPIWYVGTDVGLFMTTDSGATWKNMNALGLPNVHVNALTVSKDKAYLYVATFGRGIWRIPLVNNTFNSFTLSSSEVYGDRSLIGTLQLATLAPAGGVRAVLSTASSYVTIPSEVWIPGNASSVSFTITTSQVFSSNKTAVIFANCMGQTRSATLTIKPYPTVASFVLTKTYLYGGSSTQGTATLSAAAPFVGSMTFTEDSPLVSVVSPITIAAGETSKVTVITTTSTASTRAVPITAAYKGTTRVATLSVFPVPVVTDLSFSPNPLLAGFSTTCTITLSVPAPITTTVVMTDDSPYIATSNRTIQAGNQTLSFLIYGSNPDSDVDVKVNAKVLEDPGNHVSATLTLWRSVLQSIAVSPNPIKGGEPGIGTISLNRPVTLNRVVQLGSENTSLVSVPAGVTVVAGNNAATFTVRTVRVTSTQNVVVGAQYLGQIVHTTVQLKP